MYYVKVSFRLFIILVVKKKVTKSLLNGKDMWYKLFTRWYVFRRYIAVCFPLLHRDLVHTYSIMQRVTVYTVPVMILSILINIPKFLETKIVVDITQSSDLDQESKTNVVFNVTTYTIDVTDLR